jgi:hypothetical protein
MRAVASRAVALAIALSPLSLTDCRSTSAVPPATAAPPGAASAGNPAGAGATRATHVRLAAMVAPHAPVTLTASDGKGLALASLSARAVLLGPLAFTEVHYVFANPAPRTLEGTFAMTLPQRASIGRFAMRMGDAWQEGEVVERQRAREAFEDFLHRKRDPALLEQSAGNQFSARVFPIPAGGTKEIVVAYAQELKGDEPYVMPLRGMPEIGAVDLSATAEGSNLSLGARRETRWAPDADFVVERTSLQASAGLRSGDLVLARVQPRVDTRPDPVRAAIVLFDTSASAALDLDARVEQLGALVTEIARRTPDATVTVACFDQDVEEAYSGPASGLGKSQLDRLRARAALGASDLGRAMAWAKEHARAKGARRVVLLGDGVATAGPTDRAGLVAAARALGEAGIERLDALAAGGIRDDSMLAGLVRAGLSRDGIVADADEGAETTARRLASATQSGIEVRVAGATWQYPRTIDGAQPGDEFLVYAQVPPGAPVSVAAGGVPAATLALRPVERPLLERAWAQAKIASLVDAAGASGETEAARREIVEVSTAHRVLSPYTALLVLETESDYARFHIDRAALADVLEVQGSRVATMHRKGAVLAPVVQPGPTPTPAPKGVAPADAVQFGMIGLLDTSGATPAASASAPTARWGVEGNRDEAGATGHLFGGAVGESFGAGGLGLSGVGEGGASAAAGAGGGGRGEGIGLGSTTIVGHGAGAGTGTGFGSGRGRLGGSHAVHAPVVRMGTTRVSGRLPPEVIQRIVRQNFGRFRACYQDELRTHPTLQGRVSVRFLIDRTGAVAAPGDGGSDVNDPALVACVVRAFGSLQFPQPDGGVITVVYPLQFSPEGVAPGGASFPAQVAMEPRAPVPPPPPPPPPPPEPYTGKLADVMRALAAHDTKKALDVAWAWRDEDAGDVLALVALGEALEASHDTATAARAYGSIIDLFPSSVDLRRMAGERLDRLASPEAAALAADDYAKAVADRPDHPSSHRMLAYALLRRRDYAGAFDAALAGLAHPYPSGRYAGVDRILRDDVGLIGAAWAAAEPTKRETILGRVRAAGGTVEDAPSLRFVLSWESDGNDVDLHVRDAEGNHAFFQQPTLPTGGELYADVTTGYGPECFTIDGPPAKRSAHYALQVHYYARGPMGYGMGKVEIVEHDGHGGLKFDERPFVVMNDQAFVDLGDVASL